MSGQLGLFATSAPSLEGVNRIRLAGSYSADTIAMQSSVRKPHTHDGALWVFTGNGHGGSSVYRIVPLAEFDGEPTTYYGKLAHGCDGERSSEGYGDYARHYPMGFYHGMTVKFSGAQYVMHGPEIVLPGCILSEKWAEERTRIGNTPSEEDEEDDDETAGEDFDDDGRTAMGNEYSDADEEEADDAE